MKDEQLWSDVLAGDSSSFGQIWDRHHARVHRHLQFGGTTPTDAEDLTAVVFLELWRRRQDVRFVDGSLLPWLIVTARNVARNSVRSRRRHRRFLATLPPPEPIPDPTDAVVEHESTEAIAVRRALDALRPADATLLSLTAVDGFTVREAAGALGISEAAAKMRLSRIRARLRDDLRLDALTEGELP